MENAEYWYDFWRRLFWMVEGFFAVLGERLQTFWDKLPKVFKVAVYMAVAGALDSFARSLSPEAFSFVPTAYRLLFFNLVEVFLVEIVKALKARKQADEESLGF